MASPDRNAVIRAGGGFGARRGSNNAEQELLENGRRLLELDSSLLGSAIVATAFALHCLTRAFDPPRLFHSMEQRIQRAWAQVMASGVQVPPELDARHRAKCGGVQDT